jgi:hypothetical protein
VGKESMLQQPATMYCLRMESATIASRAEREAEDLQELFVDLASLWNYQRLALARNGMGSTRCAVHNLLSNRHLLRSNNGMKFLSLPKIRRRGRSQPRSEIEDTGGSDPAVPVSPLRPSESTPDLGIGVSAPTRSASPDLQSSGMQTFLYCRRTSHHFFSRFQTALPCPIDFDLPSERGRAQPGIPRVTPPVHRLGASQNSNPSSLPGLSSSSAGSKNQQTAFLHSNLSPALFVSSWIITRFAVLPVHFVSLICLRHPSKLRQITKR